MRLEDLGNDLQPYTVNLNELPEALQEQVFRGQVIETRVNENNETS